MDERDRNEVLSVIKAYELLDVISKERLIGLSELARKSGLKKTTVARLLNTLRKVGLVDQDESTQQFFLTMRVVNLAERVLESFELRRFSRPFIEKFVEDYGRTTLLCILNQDRIIYVDKIKGMELFRIETSFGENVPAHCTAGGKVILAHLPPERRRIMAGDEPFVAYTSHTITDWLTLEQELNAIRQSGFAIDYYERFEEIVAAAVPIFNHKGNVVGAVTTPRIITSIDKDTVTDWGKQLLELGRNISIRLGWNDGIVSDNQKKDNG